MCSTSWVSFELYFSQQQCLKITRSTDPKNSKYIFPLTEYVSHRLFLLLFTSVLDEVYMLTSFSWFHLFQSKALLDYQKSRDPLASNSIYGIYIVLMSEYLKTCKKYSILLKKTVLNAIFWSNFFLILFDQLKTPNVIYSWKAMHLLILIVKWKKYHPKKRQFFLTPLDRPLYSSWQCVIYSSSIDLYLPIFRMNLMKLHCLLLLIFVAFGKFPILYVLYPYIYKIGNVPKTTNISR